jgi:predicted dehydrogenase
VFFVAIQKPMPTILHSTSLLILLLAMTSISHLARGETEKPQAAPIKFSTQTGPLRIGIVGLVHGHVEGLLQQARERDDIEIVGIFEPNRALFDRLAQKYELDPTLYHSSLEEMLDSSKPEAVSVMTSIKDHLPTVAACAPRGVHVLVEKPLAFSNVDGEQMNQLAQQYGVLVLTNYETSWYASLREVKRQTEAGELGPIRKMIFRHGHKGPREIGCSEEFLQWLTDPVQNGGGAIIDFGCYGAALATWLMNDERPTNVTATATTLKPSQYPHVDDDATIVLTYPNATAILQASWAWTHDIKEADIHAEGRSLNAGRGSLLFSRAENAAPQQIDVPPLPPDLENEWTYLRKVIRGECAVDALSSLELNLIVVDILDQARQSAARSRETSKTP